MQTNFTRLEVCQEIEKTGQEIAVWEAMKDNLDLVLKSADNLEVNKETQLYIHLGEAAQLIDFNLRKLYSHLEKYHRAQRLDRLTDFLEDEHTAKWLKDME